MEKGGDPRTDHASLVVVKDSRCSTEMAATCPPYRPGRLATATAMSISSATASATISAKIITVLTRYRPIVLELI